MLPNLKLVLGSSGHLSLRENSTSRLLFHTQSSRKRAIMLILQRLTLRRRHGLSLCSTIWLTMADKTLEAGTQSTARICMRHAHSQVRVARALQGPHREHSSNTDPLSGQMRLQEANQKVLIIMQRTTKSILHNRPGKIATDSLWQGVEELLKPHRF